jgi:hypothetical protein
VCQSVSNRQQHDEEAISQKMKMMAGFVRRLTQSSLDGEGTGGDTTHIKRRDTGVGMNEAGLKLVVMINDDEHLNTMI